MSNNNNDSGGNYIFRVLYWIFAVCVAIVGKAIHGSVGWAIVDFIFAPFVLLKWLIYQEVNVSIIKHAFDWFLK